MKEEKMKNVIIFPNKAYNIIYLNMINELKKEYIVDVNFPKNGFSYEKSELDMSLETITYNNEDYISCIDTLISNIEKKLEISIEEIINFDRHLNRLDFENEIEYPSSKINELFRLKVSKDIFVKKTIHYFYKYLIEKKPLFVICTPGSFINNIIITIANFLEIPIYYIFHSRIEATKTKKVYLSKKYNASTFLFEEKYNTSEISNHKPSEKAKSIVSEFLDNPKGMYGVFNFNYKLHIKQFLAYFRNFIMKKDEIYGYKSLSKSLSHLKFLFKYNMQKKKNIISFDSYNLNSSYIYMPLQQIPELTLYMWGKSFSNQTENLKRFSYCIPYDSKLLLREHPNNIGRRPFNYYKKHINKDKIILGSILDSQFEYIKNSSAIITINGTTGWEAILMKKPVFTLSPSFYDCLGFNYQLKNIEEFMQNFNTVVNKINNISNEEYYQKIYYFIDTMDKVSYTKKDINILIKDIKEDITKSTYTNFWK